MLSLSEAPIVVSTKGNLYGPDRVIITNLVYAYEHPDKILQRKIIDNILKL